MNGVSICVSFSESRMMHVACGSPTGHGPEAHLPNPNKWASTPMQWPALALFSPHLIYPRQSSGKIRNHHCRHLTK